MPTNLLLSASADVPVDEPADFGIVDTHPYENIRVLAYEGHDSNGNIKLTLTLVEGEAALGPLAELVLTPGTTVTEVFDVPGRMMKVWAENPSDATPAYIGYTYGDTAGDGRNSHPGCDGRLLAD